MTARNRDVDLGPLVMPAGVGDGGGAQGSMPVQPASAADVDRFASLMRGGDTGAAMDGVLEAFAPPQRQGGAHLGEEIERLWVGDGSGGSREVRVALSAQVLPQTSVRLYETGGCLQVDLAVGASALAAWMAARVHNVASDLGARLRREVRVAIYGPGDGGRPLASAPGSPGAA